MNVRYLLSKVVPVPMRSSYRQVLEPKDGSFLSPVNTTASNTMFAGHVQRRRDTWWQWRGHIMRHRTTLLT